MNTPFSPAQIIIIRKELARILESKDFYSSKRFSALLSYLVEETLAGRGHDLKAYTIATEVFERPSDFDPQLDTVVRVEARNLRKKLEIYYAQTNSPGSIEISIPKGHYLARFLPRKNPLGHNELKQAINPNPGAKQRQAAPLQLSPQSNPQSSPQFNAEPSAQPIVALEPPGIIIFPFANLSSNQDAAHLVRGFVEEIAIGLTRFQDVTVINSNFQHNLNQPEQNRHALAQKMGARFMLQGTVQVFTKTIRIRVSLTDANNYRTLWANKYDTELGTNDFMDILDEISNKVLAGIAGSFGTISQTLLQDLKNPQTRA